MADLDIGCTISTPIGTTLNLQQTGVYKLEPSAGSERQVAHRKQTAKNPYVEGEYVVSVVRENVTETLAVWCYATTSTVLRQRIVALLDCFDQPSYTVVFRDTDSTETWAAQAADYTIKSDQVLRKAKMALVTAQVPRLPTVVFS